MNIILSILVGALVLGVGFAICWLVGSLMKLFFKKQLAWLFYDANPCIVAFAGFLFITIMSLLTTFLYVMGAVVMSK